MSVGVETKGREDDMSTSAEFQNPVQDSNAEQKARASARALMLRILAWECFKDPTLCEFAEVKRRLSALDGDGGAA
jgi:hypothetical protein